MQRSVSSYDRKGFTLAELLIVVAVIGVLVAIAIPIFNIQMEKAREAVDLHVTRSAASAGQEFYYAGVTDKASAEAAGMGWYADSNPQKSNAFAIYEPSSGKFYKSWEAYIAAGGKPYGKGTAVAGSTGIKDVSGKLMYDPKLDYTKGGCQVAIYPDADRPRVEVAWKVVKTDSRPWIGLNDYPVYTIYLD